MLLGAPLVIDHAMLGFPQALNDDLLAVAGGNAAEFHVFHRQVHHAAQLVLGAELAGLLQRDLGAGVLHLFHDLLLHIHPQVVLFLVHVHDHVLHALVIPLILVHIHDNIFHALVIALVSGGQGLNDLAHHEVLGNTPFLLQHSQRRKNLFTFHDLFSSLS